VLLTPDNPFSGVPFVKAFPDSSAAKVYADLAQCVANVSLMCC